MLSLAFHPPRPSSFATPPILLRISFEGNKRNASEVGDARHGGIEVRVVGAEEHGLLLGEINRA